MAAERERGEEEDHQNKGNEEREGWKTGKDRNGQQIFMLKKEIQRKLAVWACKGINVHYNIKQNPYDAAVKYK